jgi:hypothetical protein
MIDLKTDKQANRVVNSENSLGSLTPLPHGAPSSEEIRQRAYELYESRGREPGREEQDWLRAEQEMALNSTRLDRKSEAA